MAGNKKTRAVFFDRDGTIIRQVELLHTVKEIRLLPRAASALRALRRLGYLLILVTNQPVIARGIITEKGVDEMHDALQRRLAKRDAAFNAIYVCPHHPEATLLKYRMRCDCRKPEIGLIKKAAKEWRIDISRSFMVGDSTRDTLAGNRAKLTTILVQTGHGGKDIWQFKGKPDYIAHNLTDAARYIKIHGAP